MVSKWPLSGFGPSAVFPTDQLPRKFRGSPLAAFELSIGTKRIGTGERPDRPFFLVRGSLKQGYGARSPPPPAPSNVAVAQKDVLQMAPWRVEPKTKACGSPQLLNFEPRPCCERTRNFPLPFQKIGAARSAFETKRTETLRGGHGEGGGGPLPGAGGQVVQPRPAPHGQGEARAESESDPDADGRG